MDGASRMFGAESSYELDGRTYEVNPRLARDWGAVEQRILESRPNPFELAKKNAGLFADQPEMQAELIRVAMSEACNLKTVTFEEAQAWMNTLKGTAFVIWLAIRHNEGAPSADRIEEILLQRMEGMINRLVEDEGLSAEDAQVKATEGVLGEVHDRINRASGEDELGNSTGPSPRTGPTNQSPGGGSADG